MWIHRASLCSPPTATLSNVIAAHAIKAMKAKLPWYPCSMWRGSVCWDVTRIKLHSLVCLLRFPTGLGIKESDTRKTLVSSKKKPTCMPQELTSMRVMHPHMEAKQIHPQLQTLQVRQEVPGSAQLFDKYLISVHCFNQTASVVYSSEAFFRDRNLSLMTWWCTISTLHRSKVFPLTRTTATLQQSCAKKLTNLSRKPSYPLLSCLFFISVDPILFSMHDIFYSVIMLFWLFCKSVVQRE